MTPKLEREKSGSEKAGSDAGVAPRAPKVDKTWSGLDGFLRELKLLMLMREKSSDSQEYDKLQQIEKDLSSSNLETREHAKTAADELIEVFEGVKGEAGRSTLEKVVHKTFENNGERSDKALSLAKQIDIAKQEVDRKEGTSEGASTTELETLSNQLEEFKNIVGFKAMTQEGIQMAEETILKVVHLRNIRRYTENPLAYEVPLRHRREYFIEGSSNDSEDKRLRVRTSQVGEEGEKFAQRVESVKKNVREVVIDQSRELSDQEAIQTLQDVSELQANLKHLVGKEYTKTLDTLETLAAVESQFQHILTEKVSEKIRSEHPTVGVMAINVAIEEVLREVKGGRWSGGRERYKFTDNFDGLVEKVIKKAKSFERSWPKRPVESNLHDMYEGKNDEDIMNFLSGGRKSGWEKQVESIRPVLAEMGVDYDPKSTEFEKTLRSGGHEVALKRVEEIVNQARERGMSASRLAMGEKFLQSLVDQEGARFVDVKDRLAGYVKNHQFGRYIREMKAYVSRVGLRESSADFQFAIMLRDAKDVISQLEEDVAEEFEGWQGRLFIPPFKAVDPEQFRQMFERVWNASNLDHVLNPEFANAAAMLVDINGEQKVMSTAVFYQLLQRGDNATRFLNAKVDTVDSTSMRIWIDYLYGKGAVWEGDLNTGVVKDKNGNIVAKMTDIVSVHGFDVLSKELDGGDHDLFTLGELMRQSAWMHKDAETFFMYSGEAGNHMRHYPKQDMENANKWLFSQDQMFEGYGGHFGKYAAPFWQIAKLGHLLREFRNYKDSGILNSAMIEQLTKAGVDGGKAKKFADMWTNKLGQKINIDGKEFKVGLLSLEDIRLIGNNYESAEGAWVAAKDYLMAHNMPEDMIKSQDDIERILASKRSGESLSVEDQSWARQAEEFFELCKNLKWSDEERAIFDSLTPEELAVFAKRQNTIFGTSWQPKNKDEFVEGFQYAAVMDPAKYQQGTDPIEFARKYAKLSEEVAKLLPKIEIGVATSADFIEVQKALRAYLTPKEVDDFIEILIRKSIQARTYQLIPYEIAVVPKGEREIKYRSIKRPDGHTYYFIDRDGHRIAETEMYRGNYMYERWKVKPFRGSDVETLMDAMHGEAMITRELGDEMLDDLIGGGRTIDRILEKIGIKEEGKPLKRGTRAYWVKRIFARTKRLIQRLPLFDDPVWAISSLSATIFNFAGEAAKEVTKSVEK